jgi:hypothetical protein
MRHKRLPNYKNCLLLDIISEILPAGAMQWEVVATRYFELSGETEKRDADSIKRHFNDKLCNGGKKPTGESGNKNELIFTAQRIKLNILQNQSIGNVGHDEADFEFGDEDANGDDDVDEDEDIDGDGIGLFGSQFQVAQSTAPAESRGATSLAVIPNGPSTQTVAQAATKRTAPPEVSTNKTKSMKQSPRQTAGRHIDSLSNTIQDVAQSTNNVMMLQFMMQMQQQMQQQQQQQNNMMMMMMMGMRNPNSFTMPHVPSPVQTSSSSGSFSSPEANTSSSSVPPTDLLHQWQQTK